MSHDSCTTGGRRPMTGFYCPSGRNHIFSLRLGQGRGWDKAFSRQTAALVRLRGSKPTSPVDEDVAEAHASGAGLGKALNGGGLVEESGALHESTQRLVGEVGPALDGDAVFDDDLFDQRVSGDLDRDAASSAREGVEKYRESHLLEVAFHLTGDPFEILLRCDHLRMVSGNPLISRGFRRNICDQFSVPVVASCALIFAVNSLARALGTGKVRWYWAMRQPFSVSSRTPVPRQVP